MKGLKILVALVIGLTMIAGIACGGTSKSPTPTPQPDLVIIDLQYAPNQDCWSSSYQCGTDVLIQNTGAGDAGPFVVDFNGIQQDVPAGLAAGQGTSLWFTLCPFMEEGTAIIDSTAQVTENNESNNTFSMMFMDPPPPTPCPDTTITPSVHEMNVDASHNGSEITLAIGDQIIVTLASNPGSTGFSWNLSSISDTDVIQWVGIENIAPEQTDPPMVGVPEQEVWTFEALAAGTATISMKYIQPWMPDADPAKTFEITVIVE